MLSTGTPHWDSSEARGAFGRVANWLGELSGECMSVQYMRMHADAVAY